jgi:hypothetical protein
MQLPLWPRLAYGIGARSRRAYFGLLIRRSRGGCVELPTFAHPCSRAALRLQTSELTGAETQLLQD